MRGMRVASAQFCALVLLALHASCVFGIEDPEDFVNLLAGTFTDGRSYSTGNTLPLVGRPWGFNHWAPQTTPQNSRSSSWWFSGNHHTLNWLRCTHQPSPWIGDWGWFLFMPILGAHTDNPNYFWEPRGAVLKPHLFDATLAPSGIRLELVPTMHAATLRVTFPENSQTQEKRVCFREGSWQVHGSSVTGLASQVNKDGMQFDNFGLHIYATSVGASTTEMKSRSACFKFKNSDTTAEIRIATSLISPEQARSNLEQEMAVGKVTFTDIKQETKSVWNKFLRRVDVLDPGVGIDRSDGQKLEINKITPITGDSSKHLTIFYTGLYRALTFPRRIDEVCHKTGKMVHFSPYDPKGGVHPGPLVTDNGFWDTFRTVYPLLGLAYRDELGVIINGWLMAYKEGKWLPSWASPGYRKCMVGTFADVVVSDAIVKGIKGFDLELAREALKKDAFETPPPHAGSAVGKDGIKDYILKGYVPSDRGNNEGVSRTLDFGFADFSTANAFEHLLSDASYQASHPGMAAELKADVQKLRQRVDRGVKSQFSSQHGLMAPMSSTHHVNGGFDPVEWGKGFVEGNSWHHSFPPYALKELATLYGGKDKLLNKLKQFLSVTSDFRVGSYGQEIHEMTEMRTLAMGQYGHNNQPCHHILYLFAMLGEKRLTEKHIREVLERGYGEDFYAGDEDNGEQGAWFVLSALGLYSTVPGTPHYVLNTPLFQHTAITRGGGGTEDKPFHIIAMGAGEDRQYSKEVYLNSHAVSGPLLSDLDIAPGGMLQFILDSPEEMQGEHVKVFTPEDLIEVTAIAPAPVAPSAEYAMQLEKKQEEIEHLRKIIQTNEHLTDSQNHHEDHTYHIAREPVLQHHISDTGVIIVPETVSETGCGHSSTLYTGLVILCANLIIVCWMLALQVQKYRNAGGEGKDSIAGSSDSSTSVCQRLCSCLSVLPVLIKEGLVSVVGIQTFQSVVSRNKEKPYTV